MQPLRFGFFFTAVALLLGVSLTFVLRALFPRRFQARAARLRLRAGAAAAVLAVLALETHARLHAPAGGGALRVPIALERTTVFVVWLVALGLLARNALFALARRAAPAPASAAPAPSDAPAGEETVTRREALARASTLAIAGVGAGVGAYGSLRAARDLRVRDVEVYVPDLPAALEGLTLAQLTDIHVGIFTGPRDFAAVADRVRALAPDLLVLTGDLLDNNPAHVPDAMRLFARLRSRLGTYAVLGNHDYYTGYRDVLAGLQGAGITALVNRGVVLPGAQGSHGLALLGLDELMAPRMVPGRGPDLARALATVPPEGPRVVLAHNPLLFDTTAPHAALQLSGHTHGGQINPAGVADLAMRYVSGRYARGASTLFVSNGLGLTGPPVRLAAPPEIVRVGLTGRRRG